MSPSHEVLRRSDLLSAPGSSHAHFFTSGKKRGQKERKKKKKKRGMASFFCNGMGCARWTGENIIKVKKRRRERRRTNKYPSAGKSQRKRLFDLIDSAIDDYSNGPAQWDTSQLEGFEWLQPKRQGVFHQKNRRKK